MKPDLINNSDAPKSSLALFAAAGLCGVAAAAYTIPTPARGADKEAV